MMNEVRRHVVEYDVSSFIVGRYGNFDSMSARAVTEMKRTHPQICLTLLVPYHPGERMEVLPPGFDDSIFPDNMERVPRRFAIVRANREMIKKVDFLIVYVNHPASNSIKYLDYANHLKKEKPIHITNLGSYSSMRED